MYCISLRAFLIINFNLKYRTQVFPMHIRRTGVFILHSCEIHLKRAIESQTHHRSETLRSLVSMDYSMHVWYCTPSNTDTIDCVLSRPRRGKIKGWAHGCEQRLYYPSHHHFKQAHSLQTLHTLQTSRHSTGVSATWTVSLFALGCNPRHKRIMAYLTQSEPAMGVTAVGCIP